MQTNKYKVGEKVIISESVRNHELANCMGKMDKWIGKVMTIKSICSDVAYRMIEDVEENSGGYFWFEDMIQGLADSKLDRFAKGEIVLHIPTQEIYNKLMQWCDEKGITWSYDKATSKNIFNGYENLCIFCFGMRIRYGSKRFALKEGHKIETLSLSDFGEPKGEPKLKVLDGIYECISAKDDWFTVGVLYEVKNGYTTCDYGETRELFRSDDTGKGNSRNEFYYYREMSEPTPEPTPEPLSITIEFNGRETVAKLLKNGKPVKQAVAKCLPTDKFSEAVGSQLALARLFEKKQKEEFSNETIDNFVNLLLLLGDRIVESENKEKSQVKEVKRKAKVGEYVKVVNEEMSGGCYKNGDILYVLESVEQDRTYREGVWVVTTKTHDCAGRDRKNQSFLATREYVVLEGYKHVR